MGCHVSTEPTECGMPENKDNGKGKTKAMTATKHKDFASDINTVNSEYKTDTQILEGTDLYEFHEAVKTHGAELILGNSKEGLSR